MKEEGEEGDYIERNERKTELMKHKGRKILRITRIQENVWPLLSNNWIAGFKLGQAFGGKIKGESGLNSSNRLGFRLSPMHNLGGNEWYEKEKLETRWVHYWTLNTILVFTNIYRKQ